MPLKRITRRLPLSDGFTLIPVVVSEESEHESIEISPNITAELDEKGAVVGIEFLDASIFIPDSVLESAQATVLDLLSRYGQH